MKKYKTLKIGFIYFLLSIICVFASDGIKVETILDNESKTWIKQDLPKYPKGNPRVSILKFTVPPKQKLPKHFHSVINVAYMIKGELTVKDDESNSKTIKAGEPLVELIGKIHYGENTGNETAELIVFYINDDTNIPITTKVE